MKRHEENDRIVPLGVRATYPMCDKNFLKYGGNTLSVLIVLNNTPFIVDAGTGLMNFNKVGKDFDKIYLFFSHYHLDHVCAFSYLFTLSQEREITILQEKLHDRTMFLVSFVSEPLTPIPFGEFFKNITFLHYENNIVINGVEITRFDLNHPGTSYGYSFKTRKHKVVTIFDNEVLEFNFDYFLKTAKGSDAILIDTTYKEEDYIRGWGHSTFKTATKIAKKMPETKVICLHYNYTYDDHQLAELEKSLRKRYPNIIFARELQGIDL